VAITKQGKFRNQQVIVTVAVPVGKRIYINENVGWGENVRVNLGRGDDYWEWENNMESVSFRWKHNVEYVMTPTGLERVDRLGDDEENNDNSNETIEQFRKSKEQMEREKEQKLKELQEIEKELQKTDTTINTTPRYRYKPTAPQGKVMTERENTAMANTTGISDMLMIKFAL